MQRTGANVQRRTSEDVTCTPVDLKKKQYGESNFAPARMGKKDDLGHRETTSGLLHDSLCVDVYDTMHHWRDVLVEQMLVRNSMQVIPFIDITKGM